jgi:large subunit ribosomal protein L23
MINEKDMALINRKKKVEEKAAVEKTSAASVALEQSKVVSARSNRTILKPLITEKSAVAQSLNKYSFIVAKRATKTDIKKAVKEIYGVEPSAVNIANFDGKSQRRGASTGRRQDYKKAVVTLPKGKTIAVHEGV